MKSLQYTFGIIFGLFITIGCKQIFYTKYILENSVSMSYSLEMKYISSTRCTLLCLSTDGCTFFYWYNRSCYILNTTSPGNNLVNIGFIYIDDDLKDNCNLDGYDAIFGGVLCVKLYDVIKNWADAKTACEQDGGQLLVMRTGVFFIKLEAVKSLQPLSGEYWIGGNDLAKEGEFKWIDGSDVTTEGWGPGLPDNYNGIEHCLKFKHLELDDNNCIAKRFFFCEKPLI